MRTIRFDGPGIYAHIEKWHPSYAESLSDTHLRRISAWRSGVSATIWTVDAILCSLDSHLSALPEGLELDPKVRRKAITAPERREIVRRYRAGETTAALSQELGRCSSSILKWNRSEPGYVSREKTERAGRRKSLTCNQCGFGYERLESDLRRREFMGKFCSRECGNAAKREEAAERRRRDAS